jgi:hypothetical protein
VSNLVHNHHWPHASLVHSNNQILEIENEDDVDDLTIFCLDTIMISHRLLIAAISNVKDNSKCKSDQTKLIT